jgi:hypothetical protein
MKISTKPITSPTSPIKSQDGCPSGLNAPKMNRKENIIIIAATIKEIIFPARMAPPLLTQPMT